MRKLLTNITAKAYNKIKSSKYFSDIYYSVANSNYFTSFLEHEKMIGDKSRMDAYHKGITKHVKEGDVVIDLGTGTGILSFFASQKSPAKIYAIDHGKILESAKKISEHNKIKNIEFVNANSKNFTMSEKADIIIHEQIGAMLFDEHMIDNLLDLKERLLKKDGKILPGKYEVFLAPVKLKDHASVPYIWEQEIYGVRYDCFDELKKDISPQYGILKVRPEVVDYFLSDPEKILYFDMDTMKASDIAKDVTFTRKITKGGRLDGFCFYFNIIFDDEIILSTNPFKTITHWNVPILRTEGRVLKEGDEIKFKFEWENPEDVATYKWSIL